MLVVNMKNSAFGGHMYRVVISMVYNRSGQNIRAVLEHSRILDIHLEILLCRFEQPQVPFIGIREQPEQPLTYLSSHWPKIVGS